MSFVKPSTVEPVFPALSRVRRSHPGNPGPRERGRAHRCERRGRACRPMLRDDCRERGCDKPSRGRFGGTSRVDRGGAGTGVVTIPGVSPRIVLATRPVDFRRGHGALAEAAAVELGLDIHSGVIVIFRSKRGNRLKLIYWEPRETATFRQIAAKSCGTARLPSRTSTRRSPTATRSPKRSRKPRTAWRRRSRAASRGARTFPRRARRRAGRRWFPARSWPPRWRSTRSCASSGCPTAPSRRPWAFRRARFAACSTPPRHQDRPAGGRAGAVRKAPRHHRGGGRLTVDRRRNRIRSSRNDRFYIRCRAAGTFPASRAAATGFSRRARTGLSRAAPAADSPTVTRARCMAQSGGKN